MTGAVRIYFASDSNAAQFAVEVAELHQAQRSRSVAIHDDYVELAVYNSEEYQAIKELAAEWNGQVWLPPTED